jgi:hypothetical protein
MYSVTGPLNYCRPSLVDGYNQGSPVITRAYPVPPFAGVAAALFRAGDFLVLSTTGTLTYPAAPANWAVGVQPSAVPTVAYTTTGTANQRTLYYYYTYTDGTYETLPSPWFTLPMPQGTTATITVPTAGAPGSATEFNLYMGYNPYQAWQQVAGTSLGSAAAVPTGNALTNYQGAIRSGNDPSANILGLALDDYDILFTNIGEATGAATYANQTLFGPDMTSLDPEQYQVKYAKMGGSPAQRFVISCEQPSPGLFATAGLVYSSTQNVFYLDTSQSNKIVTIVDIDDNLDNWPASQPFDTGLAGAQVIAAFNAGVLP